MRRFILENNISRFQALLSTEVDEAARRTLKGLLLEAERELSLLNADVYGAREGPGPRISGAARWDSPELAAFRREFETSPDMLLLVDQGPGLHIVDANRPYLRGTGRKRKDLIGLPLFEAFPDNPDDQDATGVRNLYESLKTVVETGRPHAMRIQRYDVRDGDGHFAERYWRPMNTPLFDDQRRLAYLLHWVQEVTAEVQRGAIQTA